MLTSYTILHRRLSTEGFVPTPRAILPRAPYRPRRHTTEGFVPTPRAILSRAPYRPRRHTTEGSLPTPRAILPRASEGFVPTPEAQHRGLPCKPPTLDETQHREESSRRADLAMCSITTLSLSSSMTSPEAVTRAYSPRASLEATQT
ncbi:hypothetical protein RHGRI_038537 [Rhododendron griersonianum]|uniref:Uncharacterized protein n=1 Tax=Rhododendron griersonianum TaxID=479676 RepID=A0AAV6HLW2_9ERIC|nr:hypothetical protein RHGRI_038537 [Rhododendron griersonianum]